jgi:hypothetical protein
MGQNMSLPVGAAPKSLISSKKRLTLLTIGVVSAYLLKQYVDQEKKKQTERAAARAANGQDNRNRKQKRVGVDARFLAQIKKILPICIPGKVDLIFFSSYRVSC